jgi:hypothetical protein
MFELKKLSKEAIPAALQKAERYRLINQPWAAESICRDILAVDPEHQQALVTLLLAITDQFGEGLAAGVKHAREVAAQLKDDYKRAYYSGIICERQGKAHLDRQAPGAGTTAYEWFREAMDWYERAESMRPAGNDESILRWNTCVRLMEQRSHVRPAAAERYEPALGE